MSFDAYEIHGCKYDYSSQSLSSRAMSFDSTTYVYSFIIIYVSIPFEQGDVFRQYYICLFVHYYLRLNPFRAGRCLSTTMVFTILLTNNCLNPFRAGRCLSTLLINNTQIRKHCLNPFRTGRCLSTNHVHVFPTKTKGLNPFRTGRCLSTHLLLLLWRFIMCLNPFRTGRCLSTATACWKQESCGLSDPLPNFFGRLRSWLLI